MYISEKSCIRFMPCCTNTNKDMVSLASFYTLNAFVFFGTLATEEATWQGNWHLLVVLNSRSKESISRSSIISGVSRVLMFPQKKQLGLLKRTIRLGFGSVCHSEKYQPLLEINCMNQNLSPSSKH